MATNGWKKVEVDVSEELSFNVSDLFGVDIIRSAKSSVSVHLENCSDNILEFALLWPISIFKKTQPIIVIEPGFIDHKSIPSTMKKITFFWRRVN